MNWRSVAAMCVAFLLCAASANAQFDSAQISGVVQDTTGAVLPGVDVTLTNVGTKIERQAVTNEAGHEVECARRLAFRATEQPAACLAVLSRYADELARGALITAEPGRTRVRPKDA